LEKAGYDMIGFDVSTTSLEKNIELTRQAVEAVKSINPRIVIEGELGFIGSGSEIHETVPESSHLLTKTDDAKRFVAGSFLTLNGRSGRNRGLAFAQSTSD
jgi:fructose-bisphosphate aldolase, class II